MTLQEIAAGRPALPTFEADRLAGLALVRIAAGGASEADLARDLAGLVPTRAAADIWRFELSRLVAALVAGAFVERLADKLRATSAGYSAAAEFLGGARSVPASWPQARDGVLMACALGLATPSAARLKSLTKADGLRAMIVIGHWDLALKGAPSPARVRQALAVKALERAFGNRIRDGLGAKSSLPAKAARLLAAQLSASPRDYGTDARLVAAMAAEAVGTRRSDLKSLQLAVLRRFAGGETELPASRPRRQRQAVRRAPPVERTAESRGDGLAAAAAPRLVEDAPTITLAPAPAPASLARPDPEGFARAVNAAALSTAEGWPGNRKAFISRVWAEIAVRHAAWALTEIEFKCMLTEAHRTGLVALANADLKDKRQLKELQDSSVVYKNTVWHYVRVQD